jgi:hypothetical protein
VSCASCEAAHDRRAGHVRLEQHRLATHRLAILRHAEELTGIVAATCCHYGIGRTRFSVGSSDTRSRASRACRTGQSAALLPACHPR